MKKTISVVGAIVALLSVAFLVSQLIQHLTEIPSFNVNLASCLIILVAVLVFGVEFALGVIAWVILLRGGSIALPFKDAYAIMGKAQIAKYLPGNVFHFVGRLTAGTRAGLSTEGIALSMGLETLLLAATAGMIALIGFLSGWVAPYWSFGLVGEKNFLPIIVALGAILILAGFSMYIRGGKAWVQRRLTYLHPAIIGCTIAIYGAAFLVNGLVIRMLLNGVWIVHSDLPWYRFSCGYALAWVMGFIVPGAPGGIGIREAVFVGLFGKEIGEGLATGLGLLLRVITSGADLGTLAIAWRLRSH